MPSRFTLTLIDTARANLDSLPEADKDTREVSLREAIRALTPTLRKLERRGYSRQTPTHRLQSGSGVSLDCLSFSHGAYWSRGGAFEVDRGVGHRRGCAWMWRLADDVGVERT